MRFLEFSNGPNIVITNEEHDVLDKVIDLGQVSKKKFSEREQHLANQLVNKDLLLRKKINDQIIYTTQPKAKNINLC